MLLAAHRVGARGAGAGLAEGERNGDGRCLLGAVRLDVHLSLGASVPYVV